MVTQSTQTDPQPVATDDPLARAILNVVDLPLWTLTLKANRIVWATSTLINLSLWDTNYKKEGILTMLKVKKYERTQINKNHVQLKHDLT